MDHVTADKRSLIMSRVPSFNTSPEIAIRKLLHNAGFRFRLHPKHLPGRPDIVLPRLRLAIFVHGCFWHGHEMCRYGRLPKSRLEYWGPKISANRERDWRNADDLMKNEWTVEVIWQCETRNGVILAQRLSNLVGRDVIHA